MRKGVIYLLVAVKGRFEREAHPFPSTLLEPVCLPPGPEQASSHHPTPRMGRHSLAAIWFLDGGRIP